MRSLATIEDLFLKEVAASVMIWPPERQQSNLTLRTVPEAAGRKMRLASPPRCILCVCVLLTSFGWQLVPAAGAEASSDQRRATVGLRTSMDNETLGAQVGAIANQLIEDYLSECQLVMISTSQRSSLFEQIARTTAKRQNGVGVVALEIGRREGHQPELLPMVWRDAGANCRVLFLDDGGDTSSILEFLEASELSRHPDVRVIFVGTSTGRVLYHRVFRNTIHALYLSFDNNFSGQEAHRLPRDDVRGGFRANGRLYQRCLYCLEGEESVRPLLEWEALAQRRPPVTPFPDQFRDFFGHRFRVVAMRTLPWMDYEGGGGGWAGGPLTPRDSLNARMLRTMAEHSNFTYEVREPPVGRFGLYLGNGSWTGIVGALQQDVADFSTEIGLLPPRLQAMEPSFIYARDRIVIASPKPGPLPQHLAISRPFAGTVWLLVLAGVLVSDVVVWVLLRVVAWVTGAGDAEVGGSVLYSWAVLMENPPPPPSSSSTIRVTVGFLLLYTLVINSAYRSSLIAHLTVQGFPPPINSFEDLLEQGGWTWGSQPLFGTFFVFFNQSSDPVVQQIYAGMEVASMDEHLAEILKKRHAFVDFKYNLRTQVAARLTDALGYTPVHLSRSEYPSYVGDIWGFRKGAPFRHHICMLQQRLIEAGLIDFWLRDVIRAYADRHRAQKKDDSVEATERLSQDRDGTVVLNLSHLQGAFYLLLLGHGAALLLLLLEVFVVRVRCASRDITGPAMK
ncbi:glutamate receptor ionotropic, delta-1-like isoform X2 [Penaeus chinensis]|uniref:glutamate receptor ionotropic, delta-1-like isoform X2 n=1 Tax=Penaeus chinensis TaxID=139456 RepID=UPI001FB708D2|nr:glutamate receptor ionotropic, delta-1-like isoform X2 [Penaeus chinensis]